MAVVAVGDFDVDEVEAMIKEKFGRIPQSESAPERVSYPVPDHAETLIAIASDEEASSNRVEIMYKHDPQPMKTLADYRRNVIQRLASNLINARLDELGQQATPPFTYAYSGYSNMARTKDAYSSVAIVGEEQFLSGLKSLLIENERAQRFGFTQSELDRIKNATLSRLQAALKEADKTESSRLVMSYVYHFLEDSPVPGIEQTVALYEQLLPGINLEEINAAFEAFLTEENRVLVVSGVKKEGVALPTETEVRALLQEVSQQALTAYEDNVSAEPLMAELPTSGSISSEKEEAGIGVTELTLSNGVRVILKPTDFKNDEISLTAYSPGGSSLYDDETYWSASFADAIVSESGLAGFDNVQLTKYLSDKVVSASPYISELEEGIQAASSPADLETCLQLVHLYFTQPRKDEQAFASLMAKNKSYYANILSNPEYWFRGEVLEILYGNHPRRKLIAPPEELDKIKLDKAYEVYQDRFSDASDFTFLLVGAFEVEAIKPLLAQYLGSLPNQAREENWKDVGATPAEGPLEKSFYRGKEPKSQVQLMINDTFEWNAKTRYDLNSAMQVLGIMLRESMREDMGGVYGVRSGVNASRYPQNRYSISISFTCAPENVKGLIEAARRDMENLQENGPSEKNLQKIKETQRKEQQLNLQDNRFWLRSLEFAYQNELDPNRILDAEKRIDALTAEDVQQAAQKYMDLGKLTQFVLYPESEDVQP
jgi:zinc protease